MFSFVLHNRDDWQWSRNKSVSDPFCSVCLSLHNRVALMGVSRAVQDRNIYVSLCFDIMAFCSYVISSGTGTGA